MSLSSALVENNLHLRVGVLKIDDTETCGTATLVAGTIVVPNTRVTANTVIILCAQDNSSIGTLRVTARIPGTSFLITSTVGTDSGVVGYLLIEPF